MMFKADINILELISATSLRSLKFSGYLSENKHKIINFLVRQEKIENLKFENMPEMPIFCDNAINKFPFKLKVLEIHNYNPTITLRVLPVFLKFHLNSLRKLSLKADLHVDLLKFVLKNLSSIQTLKIYVHQLPSVDDSNFWDNLQAFRHIKTLCVLNSLRCCF